jgi:flavin-binding protein dodecin
LPVNNFRYEPPHAPFRIFFFQCTIAAPRGLVYSMDIANHSKRGTMGNTYKKIEMTGTSEKGIEDAVQTALAKSSESVRNMRWFEVTEVRGAIDGENVSQWQVTIKVGFTVE